MYLVLSISPWKMNPHIEPTGLGLGSQAMNNKWRNSEIAIE